jgi:glycosyltransferase involved in cell wall biosynthesis
MSPKRKVVIIGSAYPLRGGGIATFNERLAKAFSDHGDDVRIETFKLQYPAALFPGKTQYSNEAPPEGLNISVTISSIDPFTWIKIGRKIRDEKPDLVIIRYWIPFMAPCFGTLARIIRKNKHSRIIAIADNIVPHEKMPGMTLLTSWFVASVHGFMTMSRAVLEDLNKFDLAKPRVYCPHPLYDNFGEGIAKEEAKAILQLDQSAGYVLFFGFIREYKGLDLLIRAFADPKLSSMPVKALVAGEFYSDPKPYFDLIAELNLQDRFVIRNDFIPNTDVYKYFSAADVVVQPYKEATQSGVTQVAYHFNKPMITTNVGGLSETVPDGRVGFVVEPGPKEVADAIYRFYTGHRENEFSENAKEEKKKYSWEHFINKLDELLQEIK